LPPFQQSLSLCGVKERSERFKSASSAFSEETKGSFEENSKTEEAAVALVSGWAGGSGISIGDSRRTFGNVVC
jgi:hypothetical protein